MTPDIYLSEGDRHPSIPDTLTDVNGGAVVLTDRAVKFTARRVGTTTVAIAAKDAVIVGALYGTVRYDLDAADIVALKSGMYFCFWRVIFSDGTTQRHPNDRMLLLKVSPS